MSENQVQANEQEIGYLRIVFGILLVGTMSLAGWVFTTPKPWYMKVGGAVSLVVLSAIMTLVHRAIMRLIDQIRSL